MGCAIARQLELVNAAESGLLMAKEQGDAFKAWPKAGQFAIDISMRYADVAQNSDLVQTGRAMLKIADDESRLFPVELMDILLAELRRELAAAHTEKTGVGSQEVHDFIGENPVLEGREAMLRAQLVKVRDLVLQHPEEAKAALKPLFDEIQGLQVEVTLVFNMDECDRAWRALSESTSTVGELRSIVGDAVDLPIPVPGSQPAAHGNAILRRAQDDALRLNTQWNDILFEYRSGDPKRKEKAVKDLHDKSHTPEWTGFMEHIRQIISDQATYDKWMTFGLMVGIALLTGGIGTYVEAAAGAAWGAWAGFAASTVTEAAAFTSMSYFLVTKDPTIGGMIVDFRNNVLTFGGLKIVSRLYRLGVGADFAASLPGKAGEVLTNFAVMNGATLYMADRDQREKTGHGLTWSQIGDISVTNIGFLIATAIGSKLGEPIFKNLQLAGDLHGNLVRVENVREQLLDLSEQVKQSQGKDPAVTKRMLEKQSELVTAADNAVTRLEEIAADRSQASAAGLTPDQAKALSRAGELGMAKALEQFEPVGPNEVAVEKGKINEIRQAFDKPPIDRRRRDGRPGNQAPFIRNQAQRRRPIVVTERAAAKGEIEKPPDAVPEGEPVAEPEAVKPGKPPKAPRPRGVRLMRQFVKRVQGLQSRTGAAARTARTCRRSSRQGRSCRAREASGRAARSPCQRHGIGDAGRAATDTGTRLRESREGIRPTGSRCREGKASTAGDKAAGS